MAKAKKFAILQVNSPLLRKAINKQDLQRPLNTLKKVVK